MKPVFFCDCEFHFPIFGLFLILGVLEAGFPFYRVIPFYRESRAGGKDPKSAQFPILPCAHFIEYVLYIKDFGSGLIFELIYMSILESDTPFLKTIVDLQHSNVMRLRREKY